MFHFSQFDIAISVLQFEKDNDWKENNFISHIGSISLIYFFALFRFPVLAPCRPVFGGGGADFFRSFRIGPRRRSRRYVSAVVPICFSCSRNVIFCRMVFLFGKRAPVLRENTVPEGCVKGIFYEKKRLFLKNTCFSLKNTFENRCFQCIIYAGNI